MATGWYERLSMLDFSFLLLEGPNTYMHIAATTIFETGPLATAAGGIDIGRVRRYIASRLHWIPRYRQRLAYVPVEGHPVWVDDDQFEVTYHVRHTSLPRPGSDAQLRELCARLLERPLNRAKPLWEIWVVEGLAERRFALVFKVHHCMVDGLAGLEILAALCSPAADSHIEEPPPWTARPAPTGAELLRGELRRRTQLPLDLLRGLRQAGVSGDAPSRMRRNLRAAWQLVRDGLHRPAPTPLNRPIGPHRRFDWLVLDLAEVKQIKNHLGGTINDVVLTTVAGGLRRYFEQRQVGLRHLDFRVAVPVNVRPVAERGAGGNRVSVWLMPLPIHERQTLRRLHTVRLASERFKESDQATGAEVLAQAAEWTAGNVLSLGLLVANRDAPFNLIVTNVPGPPIPLYFCGAPMVAAYPLVPLFGNQGLGVALFSYAGKLYWGFNADWDIVPDLEQLVAAFARAFRELHNAAVPRNLSVLPPPLRPTPRRSARRATRAKRRAPAPQPLSPRAG